MRKIILLSLLLFVNSLFSDEPSDSLASTEGFPSSLVRGCVCAITGEYVDSEVDLVVPGPKPLTLRRTYRSGDTYSLNLYRSWQLAEPDYIEARTISQQSHRSWIKVVLTTAHGARANYMERVKNNAEEVVFSLGYNFGYTNCGTGWMSGKTNLRNNRLVLRNQKVGQSAQVTNGEGGVRNYYAAVVEESNVYFLLADEESRNNLKKSFRYDQHHNWRVASIVQTDKNQVTTYGSFLFEHKDIEKKHEMRVKSDIGELVYHFKKNRYKIERGKMTDYYIEKAERPTKPWVQYEYVDAHQKNHLLLSKKISPNNRTIAIEYYRKGDNPDVGIHATGGVIDRVKRIKAPLNQDSPELVDSHRFFYDFSPHGGGNTKVYDALNNLTHYIYDGSQRLHRCDYYSGPHQIVYKQYFFWGPWGNHDGNLLATYQLDAQDQIIKAKAFRYDNKDNVTSIREYGNITGISNQSIQMDHKNLSYPAENGAEYHEKFFTYDQLNRLIEESEHNGKVVQYIYKEGSDCIAFKKTICGESQQREHFEYDHRYYLTHKMVDHGDGTPQIATFYTPRDRDGLPLTIEERWRFNGQDQLLHKICNEYSSEGYILKQDHYDSENQHRYTLLRHYDKHGNLIWEQDAIGQQIHYFYDENDNLIKKVDHAKGYETLYAYDYLNRLTNICESHSHCSLNTSYRYDYLGNRTKIKDYHDNETDYQYDAFGKVTKITYPTIYLSDKQMIQPTEEFEAVDLTDKQKLQPSEEFEYDSLGYLTKHKDKRGSFTLYKHNSQGKPLTITHPDSITESFVYNINGTLHKQINKDTSYIIYTYDALQRITSKQVYSPNDEFMAGHSFEYDFNNLIKEIDEEGLTTTYTYDPAGRLSVKMRGDQKTTYEYDSLNRLSKEILWLSETEAQVNTYAYDLLNRITEETIQDLSGKVLTQSQYEYNAFNQKTLVKTGVSVTQTVYNSRQELVEIIDAEGNKTKKNYLYNHENSFHQKVNLVTTTDPMGLITKQEYDTHDRLASESQYFENKLLSHKHLFYNPAGDLELLQYDKVIDGVHISSVQHCWIYDAAGKLTSTIEALKTPEQQTKNYYYNEFGQKGCQENPNKESLHYAYDNMGRLSEVSSTDGTIHYTYQYNRRDQVLSCIDLINQTTTSRSYDLLGRLTEETIGNGLKISYAYDALDRKTLVTLPDNSQIEYQYDALFPRKVIRHNDRTTYTHAYEDYDIAGNLLKSQLPFQAGSLEFTYDKLNRERKIFHSSYQQEIPEDGFDKAGNLLCYTQNGETFKFSYDKLYQLSSEKDHQYAYDSLHNRIQKNQSDCTVSTLNQVLAEDGCTYKYDDNGNLIEKNEAGKITTYSYDAWNRLIAVTYKNQTTHYIYDAFHRRLSKNNEQYIYDGQEEIGTAVDGKIHNLRLLGLSKEADIGGAIAYELQNEIFLPIHDHNGNVTTLLSPKGSVEKNYCYSAFGIELNEHVSDSNPWRFSSKRYDPETGFIYFGRRYYDPHTGRWITSDPIEYADGPNLYAYVHNNPLTRYDPYGLWEMPNWELPNFNFAMSACQQITPILTGLNFGGELTDAYNSNAFQGSMRAVGGLAEAGFGATLALASCGTGPGAGVGVLAGFTLMAHGLDNYQAGMGQIFNNAPIDPLTVRGLQQTGLSRGQAYIVNDGISLVGSVSVATYNSMSSCNFQNSLSNNYQTSFSQVPKSTDFIFSEIKVNKNTTLRGWVDLRPTLERINQKILLPYKNDGIIFKNREGLLPKQPLGYYREFVHPTPGISGPGPQRIISGKNGELLYSPDHYKTFLKINYE